MGSGTFVAVPGVDTVVKVADGNIFVHSVHAVVFAGTLSGTYPHEANVVVHPDGLITLQELGTFSGTVNGASGTIVIRSEGSGFLPNIHGTVTLMDGTDGLANLHGEGNFEFASGTGTYTVVISFV